MLKQFSLAIVVALFFVWTSIGGWYSWQPFLSDHYGDPAGRLERRRTSFNVRAENFGKTPGFIKLVTVSFFEHRPSEAVPHYPSPAIQLLDMVVSAGRGSA